MVLLFFSLTLCSCKKDYLIEKYVLTEEELQYIPFQGGEKISYYNSANDEVIVLTASTAIKELHKQFDGVNTKNYYEYETLESVITGSEIRITYRVASNGKIYKGKSYLLLYWDCGVEGFPHVFGGARIPMDTTGFNSKLVLYDSLFVNGNMYFQVFRGNLNLPEHYNDMVLEAIAYPVQYFYEKQYGIIKFNFSDSTSWELEKIEW